MQYHGLAETMMQLTNTLHKQITSAKKEELSKGQQPKRFQELVAENVGKHLAANPLVPNMVIPVELFQTGTTLVKSAINANLITAVGATLLGITPEKASQRIYTELKKHFKHPLVHSVLDIAFFDQKMKHILTKASKIYDIYLQTAKSYAKITEKTRYMIDRTKEVVDVAKQNIIEDSQALKKAILYAFAPGPLVELFHPLTDRVTEITKSVFSRVMHETIQSTKQLSAKVMGYTLAKHMESKFEQFLTPQMKVWLKENRKLISKLADVAEILQAVAPELTNKIPAFVHLTQLLKAYVSKEPVEIASGEQLKQQTEQLGKTIANQSLKIAFKPIESLKHALETYPVKSNIVKPVVTETGKKVPQVNIAEAEKEAYQATKQSRFGLNMLGKVGLVGAALATSFFAYQNKPKSEDVQKALRTIKEKISNLVSLEKKDQKQKQQWWWKLLLLLTGLGTKLITTLAGIGLSLELFKTHSFKKFIQGSWILGKTGEFLGKTSKALSEIGEATRFTKALEIGTKLTGNILKTPLKIVSKVPIVGKTLGRLAGPVSYGLTGFDWVKHVHQRGLIHGTIDTFMNDKDILNSILNSAVAGSAVGAGVGALGGGIGAVPGALIGAGVGLVGSLGRLAYHKLVPKKYRESLEHHLSNISKYLSFTAPIHLAKRITEPFIHFVGHFVHKTTTNKQTFSFDRVSTTIFNHAKRQYGILYGNNVTLDQTKWTIFVLPWPSFKQLAKEAFAFGMAHGLHQVTDSTTINQLKQLANQNPFEFFKLADTVMFPATNYGNTMAINQHKGVSLTDLFFIHKIKQFVRDHKDLFTGISPNLWYTVFVDAMTNGIQSAKETVKVLRSRSKVDLSKHKQSTPLKTIKSTSNVSSIGPSNHLLTKLAKEQLHELHVSPTQHHLETVAGLNLGKVDYYDTKTHAFGLFGIHTVKAYKHLLFKLSTSLARENPEEFFKYQSLVMGALRSNDINKLASIARRLTKINPKVSAEAQIETIYDLYVKPIRRTLANVGRENDLQLQSVVLTAALKYGLQNAISALSNINRDEFSKASEERLIQEFYKNLTPEQNANVPNIPLSPIIDVAPQNVIQNSAQQYAESKQTEQAPSVTPIVIANNNPQSMANTTNHSVSHNVNWANAKHPKYVDTRRRTVTLADII